MSEDAIVQESPCLRMRIVHGKSTVHLYSEYRIDETDADWHVDQDAGICFSRALLPAVLAALKESTDR